MADQNQNHEFILSQLRLMSDTEAVDVFWQIRSEKNIDSIADRIRNSNQTPGPLDPRRLESYTQMNRFIYGHTSGLGQAEKDTEFNPQKPQLSPHSKELPNTWTDVTEDVGFIKYLLQLYFTWR